MQHKTIRTVTRVLKPLSLLTVPAAHFIRHRKRVILAFHGISRKPKFNCVLQGLFKEQLSWLKDNYAVVPLSELVESLNSPEQNNTAMVSVTFDDGYTNFAELALPILKEIRCHATIFVPSGKVEHYNDWDEGVSGFHKMHIMSYRQLRQLPEEFVEIGSHGISHIPFSRLPSEVINSEIEESRLEIEQNIGREVRFFAFPFGVYPFGNYKQLLKSYRAACTTWWGRYNSSNTIYNLRRIGVWDSDSFSGFIDKMCGRYDWLECKESIGRFAKLIKSFK